MSNIWTSADINYSDYVVFEAGEPPYVVVRNTINDPTSKNPQYKYEIYSLEEYTKEEVPWLNEKELDNWTSFQILIQNWNAIHAS